MCEWKYLIFLGFCIPICLATEPFKPRDGSLPFLVYFSSRYRGLCVGSLVSRTAVITAAVCVTDPMFETHDTRPINVVTGATYRHPRRGIRVQVTKIIIPKLSNVTGERAYMIQKSPAILLLARKVPDVLAEIPLRPIEVDYKGEEDKIYPVHKFLLQRNVRVQFLIIVKKSLWCNTITLKFQKAMTNLGYTGDFDRSVSICVKDGMYGAPFICRGKVVALFMAPDAQWANCTGHTNLVQVLNSPHIRDFMNCVSRLFEPEFKPTWEAMKKGLEHGEGDEQFDYLPDLYDKLMYEGSTSEEV